MLDRVKYYLDAFLDFFEEYLVPIMLIGIIGIFILAFPAAYQAEKIGCKKKAEIMNTEWQYGLFEGCFIKIDNNWMPYKKWYILMD